LKNGWWGAKRRECENDQTPAEKKDSKGKKYRATTTTNQITPKPGLGVTSYGKSNGERERPGNHPSKTGRGKIGGEQGKN